MTIPSNRTQRTATYNRQLHLPYLCIVTTEVRRIPNNPEGFPKFKAHLNHHLTINNQRTMKNTNKETLKNVLQFIVSVTTALLATIGVQSCASL